MFLTWLIVGGSPNPDVVSFPREERRLQQSFLFQVRISLAPQFSATRDAAMEPHDAVKQLNQLEFGSMSNGRRR
jgi:hypothetical protein